MQISLSQGYRDGEYRATLTISANGARATFPVTREQAIEINRVLGADRKAVLRTQTDVTS